MSVAKGEKHLLGSLDAFRNWHPRLSLGTRNKIGDCATFVKTHYPEIVTGVGVLFTAGLTTYELLNDRKQTLAIPSNILGISEPGQNPQKPAQETQEEFKMSQIDYIKMQYQILNTEGSVFEKVSFVEGMGKMGIEIGNLQLGLAPQTAMIGKEGSYIRLYPTTNPIFPVDQVVLNRDEKAQTIRNQTLTAGTRATILSIISVKNADETLEEHGLLLPEKLEMKEVDSSTTAPNIVSIGNKFYQVEQGRYILLSKKLANGTVEKYVDFQNKPNTFSFNRAPKDSLYKQKPKGYKII